MNIKLKLKGLHVSDKNLFKNQIQQLLERGPYLSTAVLKIETKNNEKKVELSISSPGSRFLVCAKKPDLMAAFRLALWEMDTKILRWKKERMFNSKSPYITAS